MNIDFDQEMNRLNAKPLNGRSDPSEKRLRELETVLSVQLPESYRVFLAKFGKYSVVANFECNTLPGAYIELFYGFPSATDDDLESVFEFDEIGIAPTALTIGCDLFGNQIVMFLAEPLNERVYVHEHDGGADFLDDPNWQEAGLSWSDLPKYDHSPDKPGAFQNLHFVAESFESFIKLLRPMSRG